MPLSRAVLLDGDRPLFPLIRGATGVLRSASLRYNIHLTTADNAVAGWATWRAATEPYSPWRSRRAGAADPRDLPVRIIADK